MATEHRNIRHQFDVWHMAKSLTKKLHAAIKKDGREELALWTDCIVNHLWWSADTCNDNTVQLKVSSIHSFAGVHNVTV